MRLFLAALTLATTLSLVVAAAFADEKTDPLYYTDRIVTSSGSVPTGEPARSASDIYQELRQENMGQ